MSLLMSRFERVRNSHNQPAYRVHCGTCARYTDVVRAGAADLPPEVIAKKARQRGWEIDKKGRASCPVCAEAEQHLKPVKEVTLKPVPAPENVAPLPPRQPSPTDLRRIMREIDDNWDEAKGIYSGSASDQSIADKLNVPRAWVADERKRAFGDSQRNEAFDVALQQAKTLKKDVEAAMQRALDAAALCETNLQHLTVMIKKLEKLQ